MKIARIGTSTGQAGRPGELERRAADRRVAEDEGELLDVHKAFDRYERIILKVVDRRRLIRRDADVRQAIARLE